MLKNNLHHALAFYFYYLLFDFFSCILQLSYFHFSLTASFLISLGISTTQFNKDSVLFPCLFLSTFCYWYHSSYGNTLPRVSRQHGYASQFQTSLWSFSPASLLPLPCTFKIRVLWNNMWIQNMDPQFSSKTLLHYFVLAIYRITIILWKPYSCASRGRALFRQSKDWVLASAVKI